MEPPTSSIPSTGLYGRWAKPIFTVYGLRLFRGEILHPGPCRLRMGCTPKNSGSVNRRCVFTRRDFDATDWISDAFLELNLRAPGHTGIGLALQNAPHAEAARAWVEYLTSKEAQAIYRKYGFGPAPVQTGGGN